MMKLLSRKQTIWTLSILGAAYLALFLLVSYNAKIDLNIPSHSGQFNLTTWQVLELVMSPLVVGAAYILTPLGVLMLIRSLSNKQYLDFGILVFGTGIVSALVIWLI